MGRWGKWPVLMRTCRIVSLMPAIKFPLPSIPKYIVDVHVEAGTHLRTGVVNGVPGWGRGGGIQFDLMGARTGEFVNPRPLPSGG